MAIPGSGQISISNIVTEFGGSPPNSMSQYYRDGGRVPGNNTNVPTSGLIRLSNFYGAVNEISVTLTSSASVNAQTAFGANWTSAVPKRLIVPTGVTIGPLTIPSGMSGTLEVDVTGEVQGTGGTANSGAGGNAITSSTSFTLNVLTGGAVRGGGGGGGVGGTGGGGSFTSTTTQGPFEYLGVYQWESNGIARWAGAAIFLGSPFNSPVSNGGFTYFRGDQFYNDGEGGVFYAISRTFQTTTNTDGGAGGAGGRGRGYAQTPLGGSAGSAGGTNAGTGGTGGSGAEWGLAGATGATGASGNRTAGFAGSAGGAAGRAVLMSAGTLTLNNSGTINGAT